MLVSVIFLGDKTKQVPGHGDIVVLGGVRVKEWKHQRTLETGFLTVVETNPASRQGLEMIANIGDAEPKRKVLRMTLPDPMRVVEVNKWGEAMCAMAPTTEKNILCLPEKCHC